MTNLSSILFMKVESTFVLFLCEYTKKELKNPKWFQPSGVSETAASTIGECCEAEGSEERKEVFRSGQLTRIKQF